MPHYIIWDIDPEVFRIGAWPIKWYGLMFAISFLAGAKIMAYIFRVEKKPLTDIDPLLITMMVSGVLGARLGHFLFYEPAMFLENPLRIILPPYAGLASHGALVPILVGLWVYARRPSSQRTGQTFLWLADRISITVALAGAFIRFGNLMNSEILGKPTTLPWAFVFVRNQEFSHVPRHPAPLYEALSCLLLSAFLFWCWQSFRKRLAPGTMVGLFLIWVFGLRVIWEFFKENQAVFEATMRFNMGQLLSLPAVVCGLVLVLRNVFRPSSLLPVALAIQSASLCCQCDAAPAPSDQKARRLLSVTELLNSRPPKERGQYTHRLMHSATRSTFIRYVPVRTAIGQVTTPT